MTITIPQGPLYRVSVLYAPAVLGEYHFQQAIRCVQPLSHYGFQQFLPSECSFFFGKQDTECGQYPVQCCLGFLFASCEKAFNRLNHHCAKGSIQSFP